MDMNEYELKAMAGERLAELRAEAPARSTGSSGSDLKSITGGSP